MRWLAWAVVAAALAGCRDETPPEYTKPLAEWRSTGVAMRTMRSDGGPVYQVPVSQGVLCTEARPENSSAGCGFWLVEGTGKLSQTGDEAVQVVQVEQMLEPDAPYSNIRNTARINPEQRAGSDGDLPEAPVQEAEEGESHGRHFAVGCWRQPAPARPGNPLPVDGPYACTLVVENLSLGSTTADFYAAEPGSADAAAQGGALTRARIDGLVGLVLGVEASFLPQ